MANQNYPRRDGLDDTKVYRGGAAQNRPADRDPLSYDNDGSYRQVYYTQDSHDRHYAPPAGSQSYRQNQVNNQAPYSQGQGYNRNPGYSQSQGYNQNSGYSQNQGYNQNPGYSQSQGYNQNPGYSQSQGYNQNPGYSQSREEAYEPEYDRPRQRPTMAARAAGKQNPDPYSRSRQTASAQSAHQRARQQAARQQARSRDYDYDTYYDQPRPRRRKKRHGFRNFLIFLLVLALILGGGYFLLFRAPGQYSDGWHTRNTQIYNILICATDQEDTRTDTMMIATLDKAAGTVSLTSLPRDTIVDNGEWVPKLNGVYGLAGGGESGANALMAQVQTLLGFMPDGYMVIDYQVFRDTVDALGGVRFEVPMDMQVDDPDTGEEIYLYAGQQVLDGRQALAVCRYRDGYLMADIQRQYVQQSFLKAMLKQCLSPASWPRLPAVYRAFMSNTLTDLSGANLRYLALHALLSGLTDITQNTLPGEGVDYNGASCYGLYGQSVVDMVNEVMNPFQEEITIDDVYILTVEGGELVVSTWRGEAFDASQYAYD